ncbi:MAG TPA: exosortase family protein XrtF, partial [Xanthomarina gelatinilytica]|nr:exosortase family protein XrtF [Xanthomarina gelatinilytica]
MYNFNERNNKFQLKDLLKKYKSVIT